MSAADFQKCIALGVRKINLFAEIMLEPGEAGYTDMMGLAINSMKEAVKRNMDIFGSSNEVWS